MFELIRARHGYTHTFLHEHLTHGHPDLGDTVERWQAAGAAVVVLPNGHLPYWSLMQVANLQLAGSGDDAYAIAQSHYAGQVFDWLEPAYRHLLVIDLSGRDDWCSAVAALATADEETAEARRRRDAAALSAVLDVVAAAARPNAATGATAVPGTSGTAAPIAGDGAPATSLPEGGGDARGGQPGASQRANSVEPDGMPPVSAAFAPGIDLLRRMWRALAGGGGADRE